MFEFASTVSAWYQGSKETRGEYVRVNVMGFVNGHSGSSGGWEETAVKREALDIVYLLQ
jgi:hypothetical protein